MQRFISIITSAFLLAAAADGLLRLRAQIVLREAQENSARAAEEHIAAFKGGVPRLTEAQQMADIRLAEQATEVRDAPADSYVLLASLLRRHAEQQTDAGGRIQDYCRALGALGEAINRKPMHSGYLVNWANIRQLLGKVECSESFTHGSFRAAVAAARESDPYNTRMLYAAGLIQMWSGEKADALELFRRFLTFEAAPDSGQFDYLFSLLKSGEDVRAVVPARFPQVVSWSRKFEASAPERYEQWSAVFSDLQFAALRASYEEYQKGLIPNELYVSRLIDLFGVTPGGAARVELDIQLSHALAGEGQEEASRFFDQRAKLSELQIVRAEIAADTRPGSSNLAGWGSQDTVALDEFHRSVGFYLPAAQDPALIQLVSTGLADGKQLVDGLQLMVSADNERWSRLENVQAQHFSLGERTVVVLSVPSASTLPYWKINFALALRTRAFRGPLGSLLTVYGASAMRS